jgi:hypothetical protein
MAVTTNTRIDDGGVTHRSFGIIITDSAAAAAHTLSLGFVPRYFRIHNLTDGASEEYFANSGSASLRVLTSDSGTRSVGAGNLTFGTVALGTADQVTIGSTFLEASKTFAGEAA